MRDLQVIQALLGRSDALLQAVLIACLFLTVVLRPEAIRSRSLFRAAGLLLAVSLMISPMVTFLLTSMASGSRRMDEEMFILFSLPKMFGNVLFALSLILSFLSLNLGALRGSQGSSEHVRPQARPVRPASGPLPGDPPPHPLDE